MARNRTCLACGTKYQYCPDCSTADRSKPAWYSLFCSEECMTIWNTATKFNLKRIDKQEAQKTIQSLDLKDRSAYVDCIQRDLNNILKEDVVVQEVPVVVEEVAIEPIEEEQPIVEAIVEEVVVESSIPFIEEITPIPYKKSKKNKAKSYEVVGQENK